LLEEVVESSNETQQPEEGASPGTMLPPLNISGVVITKVQLMEALKPYIPNIADFNPLQDGQHFYILFGQDPQSDQSTALRPGPLGASGQASS